ncbi:MAG: hypothetical protein N3A58_06125 [Spirochaetes bacterium]|nr:hypothetical protein [Spirochaetota bacterium]
MKNFFKTKKIFKVLIYLSLIISALFLSFGYGKNPVAFNLKANDYQKVEKQILTYANNLKNFYSELKSKDIVSTYQYDYLIKEIDKAIEKIKKTKTVYLPFGNMDGEMKKKLVLRKFFNKNQITNQSQQGQGGQQQIGQPQSGQFQQQKIKENKYMQKMREILKFKDFENSVTSIYNSFNEIIDSFISIGLITKIQGEIIKENEKLIFEKMKNENLISPFYGLKFLINISGIYIKD